MAVAEWDVFYVAVGTAVGGAGIVETTVNFESWQLPAASTTDRARAEQEHGDRALMPARQSLAYSLRWTACTAK
jgi:hypothetical protein